MKCHSSVKLLFLVGALSSGQSLLAQSNIPIAADPEDDNAPLQTDVRKTAFQIADTLYSEAVSAGNRHVPVEEYRQGMDLAAQKYNDFVRLYPNDKRVPLALYRMASCWLESGRRDLALQTFNTIVQQYKGDEAAAAAYQLANYNYKNSNWLNAERFYLATINNTGRASLQADSKYRLGRVYQQLNRRDDARKQFSEVLELKGVSVAIRRAAVAELGSMYASAGKNAEAYKIYRSFIDDRDISLRDKGDIIIRAADMADRIDRHDEARMLYEQIIKSPELSKKSDFAQLGLLKSLFRRGDYQAVVKTQELGTHPFENGEIEAQRKMIVGQSYFNLKDYARAEALFQQAERACPNSELAMEAAYRRIQSLSQLGESDSVPVVADNFIRNYAKAFPTSVWPEMVRLAAAESQFEKNPSVAAQFYSSINLDLLPAEMKKDILFKCAWALGVAGNRNGALEIMGQFITGYPKDSRMPTAITFRGDLLMKMGRETDALTDFSQVIKEWPRSEAASAAWQKSAQIYFGKQDPNNMIRCYEGLIKNFPTTMPAALAEARFMIGRGYFEKKEYDKAIANLIEAQTLNPDKYGEQTGIFLVLAYYQLQNAEKLREALEEMSVKHPKSLTTIPVAIPAWMGMQAYTGKDFRIADKYLTIATRDPEHKGAKKVIWKNLAKARLALKRYDRALEAVNMYLKEEEQPSYRRADAMLDKTLILLGLNKFNEARQTVEEALSMGVEGPLKASLNIALGDVCYAEKKYDEAAKYYGITAQLFVSDKELKPEALYKASKALEKAGRVAEAGQYKTMLEREFPGWTPSGIQDLSTSPGK